MKVTAILPLLISVFVASVLFTRVTGQNPCLGVPCNSTHICRIVSGVAVCVPCEPGFENIGGISCVPIATDPCDPTPCDSNETCEDVNGAAVCTDCPSGFTAVNNVCEDIDECTTETDNCDENANCTNNNGSFTCACNPGYSGDGVNCTALFTCTCNAGLTGDIMNCVDLDECTLEDTCDDNAMCNNTDGSFTCTCNTGFTGDGITCEDINECLTGHVCNHGSYCCNSPGSYRCLTWYDLKCLLYGGSKHHYHHAHHRPRWYSTTSLRDKIKKKYNCDFKFSWWWWNRQDGEVDLKA